MTEGTSDCRPQKNVDAHGVADETEQRYNDEEDTFSDKLDKIVVIRVLSNILKKEMIPREIRTVEEALSGCQLIFSQVHCCGWKYKEYIAFIYLYTYIVFLSAKNVFIEVQYSSAIISQFTFFLSKNAVHTHVPNNNGFLSSWIFIRSL